MSLAAEYFLLTFLAALGAIQYAAGRSGLKGLLFSQRPGRAKAVSAILALPPLALFFTWNYRNPVGIIEGAQQAGLFSLAVLAAVCTTLVLSSVLNHGRLSYCKAPAFCLEALKETTFFKAVLSRYWWKH